MTEVPRFAPEYALPPYAYVPGRTPHPVSDPAGHMYGQHPKPAELFVDDWLRCRTYLRGIDLFNYSYYWEAHEAWESLWHAAGRTGPVAEFLKGLIKLAAAGVKTLEESPAGRARHARRAAQLLRSAAAGLRLDEQSRFMGLPVLPLAQLAAAIADEPRGRSDDPLRAFSFRLTPTTDHIASPTNDGPSTPAAESNRGTLPEGNSH